MFFLVGGGGGGSKKTFSINPMVFFPRLIKRIIEWLPFFNFKSKFMKFIISSNQEKHQMVV